MEKLMENKLLIAVMVIVLLVLAYFYLSPSESMIPLPSTLAHQRPGTYFPVLPSVREGMAVSVQAPSLPFGLYNNEVVRCAQTGRIYKIENNQIRRYLPAAYVRDGRPVYRDVNCQLLNSVSIGPSM